MLHESYLSLTDIMWSWNKKLKFPKYPYIFGQSSVVTKIWSMEQAGTFLGYDNLCRNLVLNGHDRKEIHK